jgi:hypothetical protein
MLTDEKIIRLTKVKLPERGYQQITYHTADGDELTCWRPQYGLGYDGLFWRDKRITGYRMTPTQLSNSCQFEYNHRSSPFGYVVELKSCPRMLVSHGINEHTLYLAGLPPSPLSHLFLAPLAFRPIFLDRSS